MKPLLRYQGDFQWEGVPVGPYKAEGTHFRDVTRQVLLGPDAGLRCELRYFEIEPDGHSTLERHDHAHAVVIFRGAGRVLVGAEIFDVRPFDLVRIGPQTWHQFRSAPGAPLGFLCLVDCARDRPVQPTRADLGALRADSQIAAFIRT